ncbi:hypothetical protein L2E82_32166 [Cichorium intybus]|uniref:Uncharacterized protein n=1 Tax=Cichorium intybus TaxID=13427 RepID=A0ACB9BG13_CICIN|nr:hypothetical protein L2E82_32166 [Cichorium intybus]
MYHHQQLPSRRLHRCLHLKVVFTGIQLASMTLATSEDDYQIPVEPGRFTSTFFIVCLRYRRYINCMSISLGQCGNPNQHGDIDGT